MHVAEELLILTFGVEYLSEDVGTQYAIVVVACSLNLSRPARSLS